MMRTTTMLGGAAIAASLFLAIPALAADRNMQSPASQAAASGTPTGYSTINGLGGGDGSTGYSSSESGYRASERHHDWRHRRWHHHRSGEQ